MAADRSLYIVTGHSRGLGAGIAAQLLQPGHKVLGIARQANAPLAEQAGAQATDFEQWTADLAEPLAAAQRLRTWLEGLNPQDFERAVLINNAGAINTPSALRDADLAGLASVLRVGLEATLLLSASFLDATRHWPGERRLLNVSSGLGRRAMASSAAYCAAKAGMDHLTRCIALEEAQWPNGAKVASLAPGVIDTDMQVQLREASAADFPDRDNFVTLQRDGQLLSSEAAAARVLAFLARADFGSQPVADVRS